MSAQGAEPGARHRYRLSLRTSPVSYWDVTVGETVEVAASDRVIVDWTEDLAVVYAAMDDVANVHGLYVIERQELQLVTRWEWVDA